MNKVFGVLVTVLIVVTFALGIGCNGNMPQQSGNGGNSGNSGGSQGQGCASNQNRMLGVDLPGNDRAWIYTNNVDECYQACCAESWCRAYSFVHSTNQCWLKDAVPAQNPNVGVTSLVVRPLLIPGQFFPPFQPILACINQPTNQQGLHNAPILGTSTTANANACFQACCNDNNCAGYTFDSRNNNCRLFSGNPQLYSMPNPGHPMTTVFFTSGIVR